MVNSHFISQITGSYPLLADALTIEDDGSVLLYASEDEVEETAMQVFKKEDAWKELITSITAELNFRRCRDMVGNAPAFTQRAIFYINEDESIIVTVNWLFKVIGIYFDRYRSKNTMVPVEGRGADTISYYPYTALQAESAVSIVGMLSNHFADHVYFNNLHASFLINDASIFNYEETDIDLFRALFSTNMHMAI